MIRVENRTIKTSTQMGSVFEGFFYQFATHVICDSKADKFAGKTINHCCQVHVRSVCDRQIRNIANKHTICSAGCEVTVDQVCKHAPAFVAHSGLDPALLLKSEQVLGPHQTCHLFAIDPLGRGCSTVATCGVVEFGGDATSAPHAVFSVENGLDLRGHHSVI